MQRTKPRTAVFDEPTKRLRAAMFVNYRVQNNASIKQVAEHFGVSKDTVERVLSYARKAGIIIEAEDRILTELVPAAIGAVKNALSDTENPQEAGALGLKLMEASLPNIGKKAAGGKTSANQDDNALSRAIEEARQLYAGGIIDAQLVGAEDEARPALPSAAEGDSDEGPDAELSGGAAAHASGEASAREGEREGAPADAHGDDVSAAE